MSPNEISSLINKGIDNVNVNVRSEDNTHFEAVVITDNFEGKSLIKRHQMVYGCLGKLMGNEIHALSLKTYTDKGWQLMNSSNG
jgi:acid stress-induced BolA-like protein IbaG/YrbA